MAEEREPDEPGEPEEGAGEASLEKLSETRFRLRKKKELPGGLWLKCENCSQTIYRKELDEKGRVCPSCNFHFTLPGRERIRLVTDEGSWEELYADLRTLDRLDFQDVVPYLEKVNKAVERTSQYEALLCGRATILERPVVLAVLDFSFLGGSMGEVVGEKISLAAEVARVDDLPLILFTSSGGARMHEGVISLMQMAKTSAALADLSDAGGVSICVLTHPTTGGVTASFASVCDLTLAEPGALIGFAGPRVIASTIKQELPPGFQRSEFLLEKGQIDVIVDRHDLRPTLANLIDYTTFARDPEAHFGGTPTTEIAPQPAPNRRKGERRASESRPEPPPDEVDAEGGEPDPLSESDRAVDPEADAPPSP